MFSQDEKKAFFQRHDSLIIIDIENNAKETGIAIQSFKSPIYDNSVKFLAYQEKGSGQLVLMNVMENTLKNLGVVSSYEFEKYGKRIILSNY